MAQGNSGAQALLTFGLGVSGRTDLGEDAFRYATAGLGGLLADDLLEAIHFRWRATAALVEAVPGRLWTDEAPPETPLPFAVVAITMEAPEFSSRDEAGMAPFLDTVQVQFSVFATRKAECRAASRLVRDTFADATLILVSKTAVHFRMERRLSSIDPDPGPSGQPVFHDVLLFEAVLQRHL